MTATPRYVVLTGGVGGAKFARGLTGLLEPSQLCFIVNTGDDFRHLGLAVSPDLDTLMYTLADVVNADTGWGRRDETWSFMQALGELGGDTWFRLGDRDLATHVLRTRKLADGATLTAVTRELCSRLGIACEVRPMSDAVVRTVVETDEGMLTFQDYFVRRKAEPRVHAIRYEGADRAPPDAHLAALLTDPGLGAIFIAPSNPWLSIDPILAVPSIRAALRSAQAPVIAVSPIVAGRALKGPTAKIMAELGLPPGAASVASHYRECLDGFILDDADRSLAADIEQGGIRVGVTQTVMHSLDDRRRLAQFALEFSRHLATA